MELARRFASNPGKLHQKHPKWSKNLLMTMAWGVVSQLKHSETSAENS
jgi:hypothetical protein